MLFCLYYPPGNVARALSMTNELLELVPSHERALGNRAYYQKEIQSKASQSKKKRGEDGQDDTAIPEQVRSSIKLRRSGIMINIIFFN
jgi:prolyl 4-hydroxylase